jgi:hypothetical protein
LHTHLGGTLLTTAFDGSAFIIPTAPFALVCAGVTTLRRITPARFTSARKFALASVPSIESTASSCACILLRRVHARRRRPHVQILIEQLILVADLHADVDILDLDALSVRLACEHFFGSCLARVYPWILRIRARCFFSH